MKVFSRDLVSLSFWLSGTYYCASKIIDYKHFSDGVFNGWIGLINVEEESCMKPNHHIKWNNMI